MPITLEIAEKHLDTWLEAEMVVATGQSYTIGDRSLTRANLSEIRKSIEYWENKVATLKNQLDSSKPCGRNKLYRGIPIDF